MLADPEKICRLVFEFLECGDGLAAAAAVHPEDRTQKAQTYEARAHAHEEVFDEYHHRVREGVPFDASFLAKMNETHLALLPEIEASLNELAQARLEQRKQNMDGASRQENPLNLDRLDLLLHPTGVGAQE
jgi:hypothetical protein